MIFVHDNLIINTRKPPLTRKPHERPLANMGRPRRCCKLAKQATTFVIMLLIVRAFNKTTCSNTEAQDTMHHQETNQSQQLNSFRATTNLSLNPNDQQRNEPERLQQVPLASRSGVANKHDVFSQLNLDAKFKHADGNKAPDERQNYDFLGGLGDFIRLVLDELELHENGYAGSEFSSKQSLNPLDDLSDDEPDQRHLWHPNHFMPINEQHVYGGDLVPFNFRKSVRSKRDLVLDDDVEVFDGGRQFRNNNVTISLRSGGFPSNHQRSARDTGPQMIKSVNPGLNVTHMRMVNENPIKQDHLYDEKVNSQAGSRNNKGPLIKQLQPGGRRTTATAATTASATTMAPSLFNLTTRKGKEQSLTTVPDEGTEPDSSIDGVTEYPDTTEPVVGASLSDQVSPKLTTESSDPSYQDSAFNENDSLPVHGYGSDMGLQVGPVNVGSFDSLSGKKPRNSKRRANLMIGSDQVNTQALGATSMPNPSRQVPPPEQNPLKEASLRRQNQQNYQTTNSYNEDKNSANYGTVFDNPEELDDGLQYTKSPSTNLSQQVPSLSDVGSLVDPNQRQNLATNQLSETENELISGLAKDPNQLMQLIRMYQGNEPSNEKKPKKPSRMVPADIHQLSAYRPNQQAAFDSLDEQLKSTLLNHPFRMSAPYSAFNQSDAYQWPAENEHQNLLSGNSLLRDHQMISQYEQMGDQQSPPLASPQRMQSAYGPSYPPMSTISSPVLLGPSGINARPLRAIPEVLKSRLEDSFYNSNSNSNSLKHSKRATAEAKARQLSLNHFVKHKPYRHQANLISNNAPLSQYLGQAKPLQAANSYVSPTRNDPLQDSSQAEGGFQGVAPSVVSQNQVLGMLRAGPAVPVSGQQSPAASTAQLVRRALPLTVTTAQITRGRLPTLPTTAYLLPAYPTPTYPYTGTSSRYTRHNSGSSMQRLWTGSPHRVGRLATSATLSDETAAAAAATADPMWSDTQNQEDDYQQAPQTIQITAVPNGGLINNGFNTFGGGWNGWGGGPWNGRQVLLVNRQPTSEWRNWILPVAAVLSLPLVLGSLLVPVFLKSVMFLIQILQMLGFLMPPAQLAGQISSINHSPSG